MKLDIRPSDFVTIEMYVAEVHADYLELRLKPYDVAVEKGRGTSVGINHRAVVAHRPHAIEPGHKVKFAGNPDSVRGVVKHVIGDRAWVHWSAAVEDYHDVVPLAQLERENRP